MGVQYSYSVPMYECITGVHGSQNHTDNTFDLRPQCAESTLPGNVELVPAQSVVPERIRGVERKNSEQVHTNRVSLVQRDTI